MKKYDVIVIGGGHAGIEAATAAARRGAKTAVFTRSENDLGALSCNPSIGGPGKSQMISEIDALGGILPRAADMAGIHWRLLNAKHGAATQALRAQIDRNLYRSAIKTLLKNYLNLDIIYEVVDDLDLDKKIINNKYIAKSLVLTTGTFLNGLVHMGDKKIESGRLQDDGTYQDSDKNLSKILEKAGFSLIRLKTGTPARFYSDSINLSVCEIQPSDEKHKWFSGLTEKENATQYATCYITKTDKNTHNLIRKNIKNAPMYNGKITGTGPRYCPSIEDKIMRFPEHDSHHIFLEPESLSNNLIYPNGISTSFGEEFQEEWIRTISGLENVKFERYGYAIEYDVIDARALKSTLESKDIPGLFFAGQINGTSGYEEAAAQGLLAGANAAAFATKGEILNLNRDNSMTGVMIDDITTLGIDEPYRMFTSRAEYRLSLRSDNAIVRLGEMGVKLNLISEKEREIKYNKLADTIKANDAFYAGYIARNLREMESYKKDFDLKIPSDFDYNLPGLTNELTQKLQKTRPENMAALSRIPGITPAGIIVVLRKIRAKNNTRA